MRIYLKLLIVCALLCVNAQSLDDFDDEFNTPTISDPFESYNRGMTKFNMDFYNFAIVPAERAYVEIAPKPVRTSIANFFNNILTPMYLINDLLQLDLKKFETDLVRFVVNTTAGIGGIFDVAGEELDLHSTREDFGQTLGYYGVGSGFYFVLPILGPSSPRDMIGMVADGYSNPINYLDNKDYALWLNIYRTFNFLSFYIDDIDAMQKNALDPYIYMRDFYTAHKKIKIAE